MALQTDLIEVSGMFRCGRRYSSPFSKNPYELNIFKRKTLLEKLEDSANYINKVQKDMERRLVKKYKTN